MRTKKNGLANFAKDGEYNDRKLASQLKGEFTMPHMTFIYFDNWRSHTLTCHECKWVGHATEKSLDYNEDMDRPQGSFYCPRCGEMLMIVEFSATDDEIDKNWNKLSAEQQANIIKRRKIEQAYEAERIKSADQLPELPSNGIDHLIWDFDNKDRRDPMTVIRCGDFEIWRQPAAYEGHHEFLRIARIIAERYGSRIRDLRPSGESHLYLLGDEKDAFENIRVARQILGWDGSGEEIPLEECLYR